MSEIEKAKNLSSKEARLDAAEMPQGTRHQKRNPRARLLL